MKEQWKKDIRDQLKDFPKKAPEGLLDDIHSEMVRRGLTSTPVVPKRPAILLRIASIAAVLLVLFSLSHLFRREKVSLQPTEQVNVIPPIAAAEEEESQTVIPSEPRVVAKASKVIAMQDETVSNPKDTLSNKVPDKVTGPDEEETASPDAPSQETRKETKQAPQQTKWAHTPNKRKKASYDVSLYYSGLIAQMGPTKEPSFYSNLPQNTQDAPDNKNNDSISVASRALNRSFSRNKAGEKAKHHLPVKLGVSFRYYLNEQWSIQSGLTYSYLASDLSYNNIRTSYETKQKLHYIGIPVQVGLRIWESNRFRGYVSAGGQVDKLISGKATTHYTLDDRSSGTLIENISDNKLLFSTLASIGAEYMLGKDLSLYAEPGIHYYFKNGNGLKTHYNEQPLNFNITVGFRFHWNK